MHHTFSRVYAVPYVSKQYYTCALSCSFRCMGFHVLCIVYRLNVSIKFTVFCFGFALHLPKRPRNWSFHPSSVDIFWYGRRWLLKLMFVGDQLRNITSKFSVIILQIFLRIFFHCVPTFLYLLSLSFYPSSFFHHSFLWSMHSSIFLLYPIPHLLLLLLPLPPHPPPPAVPH